MVFLRKPRINIVADTTASIADINIFNCLCPGTPEQHKKKAEIIKMEKGIRLF
jgi:hypothetical protein